MASVAQSLGIRVIVPLPMSRELYELDFQTQDSRDEFRRLLEQADFSFTLDLPKGVNPVDVAQPGLARNPLYTNVGEFVARNSVTLIALWDGELSDKPGGTAQVSRIQLQGVSDIESLRNGELEPVERGTVYHVVTPHRENPHPRATPYSVYLLEPDGDAAREEEGQSVFERVMRCVDMFNRDAIEVLSRQPRPRLAADDELWPADQQAELPPHCAELLPYYYVADAMAIQLRSRARRVLKGLFGLILVAIVTFELFAHVLTELWQLVAFNVLAIALAYVLFVSAGTILGPFRWLRSLVGRERAWRMWSMRQDYKTKYLDYRALAEGLRVQFFWGIVGIHRDVADQYLHRQRSELDWIRAALRTWNLLAMLHRRGSHASVDRNVAFGGVMSHWIQTQLDFYKRRAARDRDQARMIGRWVQRLLVAAIVLTIVLYAMGAHVLGEHMDPHIREYLIATIALLSAVAAMVEGYAEKLSLAEESKQYQRMHHVFARAKARLSAALRIGDLRAATHVVDQVGREALAENGDWVLLHRARPMEVPLEG